MRKRTIRFFSIIIGMITPIALLIIIGKLPREIGYGISFTLMWIGVAAWVSKWLYEHLVLWLSDFICKEENEPRNVTYRDSKLEKKGPIRIHRRKKKIGQYIISVAIAIILLASIAWGLLKFTNVFGLVIPSIIVVVGIITFFVNGRIYFDPCVDSKYQTEGG